MKIAYIEKRFAKSSLDLIEKVNEIIKEYQSQGFDLTLRQIYYQMVARDIFPEERRWTWDMSKKKWRKDVNGTKNADPNYKWLGAIINNARLAGMLDWDAIVDRTRIVHTNSHWTTPKSILKSAAYSYLEDRWEHQIWRPEVWIEKDALLGVIAAVCEEYDVPYFSCRGYTSQSAMWQAGHGRLRNNRQNGQTTMIIHLADHDPSGIDMTRDIDNRLEMFAGWEKQDIRRIALNMDQISKFSPPPSPTKITDSRAKAYILEYGNDSWELDALEPSILVDLIRNQITDIIEPVKWAEKTKQIDERKAVLDAIANNYEEIRDALNGGQQ